MARQWLPDRPAGSHKGDFGHVLIVAGSRGMTGAAMLAAKACLRSGAGLTTLAVPKSQQPIVASQLMEAMTLPLSESADGTLAVEAASELQKAHESHVFTVLAIGPGLTTQKGAARASVSILATLALPAVVDADALNILSHLPHQSVKDVFNKRGAPAIITPHPGEAARLGVKSGADPTSRISGAQHLASNYGVTALLKGPETVVAGKTRTVVNTTGNAGLAKGGTGDALTGVIAAIWSQIIMVEKGQASDEGGFIAASLGAYLHGLAADLAVKEKAVHSLLASDVIESLPHAFRKLGSNEGIPISVRE